MAVTIQRKNQPVGPAPAVKAIQADAALTEVFGDTLPKPAREGEVYGLCVGDRVQVTVKAFPWMHTYMVGDLGVVKSIKSQKESAQYHPNYVPERHTNIVVQFDQPTDPKKPERELYRYEVERVEA